VTNSSARRDWDNALLKMAHDGGLEWIDVLIKRHEEGVEELKRQRERYLEACAESDKGNTPVTILSWTVNTVMNVQRNLRLDMVANHAAAITVAATQRSLRK